MESWDNENWKNDFPSPIDDWYNEEYTGSLADTKVFTPSTVQEANEAAEKQAAEMAAAAALQPPSDVSATAQQFSPSSQPPNISAGMTPAGAAPMGVGSLTASQSQFLSSLSAQNDDSLKGVQGSSFPPVQQFTPGQQNVPPTATVAASTGVSGYSTGGPEHTGTQQPVRTKTQRARVPPPSKVRT